MYEDAVDWSVEDGCRDDDGVAATRGKVDTEGVCKDAVILDEYCDRAGAGIENLSSSPTEAYPPLPIKFFSDGAQARLLPFCFARLHWLYCRARNTTVMMKRMELRIMIAAIAPGGIRSDEPDLVGSLVGSDDDDDSAVNEAAV